jgi:mRNA-degrading endonuclease RelE of RelBE toxin-antitoxin system
VGHYRVVYEWRRRELVILVVRIGQRREVYR